ncbi:MAG: hydantoinase/oxoprolinase family protein [Paracoccaceae bacterium]
MTDTIRAGVDIGGTFTDVALQTARGVTSVKVLTDHAAPERGILAGLTRAVERTGVTLGDLSLILHGTTLATNALIERRGARTALLTTEGFRDVIEIRTESRFDQYDLNIKVPPALIPRADRHTVAGRILASGRELSPLDEDSVRAFARMAVERGYESVAVGFLHAYVDPAHERRAGEILAEVAPGLSVSLSSDVAPQMREFERFNTACANAYVKPLMASYLGRLTDALAAAGAGCPVVLMHSGGGLIPVETARQVPVRLLESGPAGGAIFAADLARRHGLDRVLSFDMGGTTAKICLIRDGAPRTARSFEVARTQRFAKGSGMPIAIPVIEMVEIGAGGGSLAGVDGMGRVTVGPHSAGSEPGPACYGRGGARPAVTDADLVLGRLDPEGFAGGTIRLDAAAAEAALGAHVGDPLGSDATAAAAAVAEVVDETMANAARAHAVESGAAPSDHVMIAFGGAAPLHAARLAAKLGVARVLIPPGAGVGSAIGFLRAPFGFEAVRGAYRRLSELDPDWLAALLADLEDEARAGIAAAGPVADAETRRRAYMRYAGQGWEIAVELPETVDVAALRAAFEAEYARLFGRALTGLDVEVLNWSVLVQTPLAPPDPVAHVAPRAVVPAGPARRVTDPATGAAQDAAAIDRADLSPGDRIAGPAVVAEAETTTILPAGATLTCLADGALLMCLEDAL